MTEHFLFVTDRMETSFQKGFHGFWTIIFYVKSQLTADER